MINQLLNQFHGWPFLLVMVLQYQQPFNQWQITVHHWWNASPVLIIPTVHRYQPPYEPSMNRCHYVISTIVDDQPAYWTQLNNNLTIHSPALAITNYHSRSINQLFNPPGPVGCLCCESLRHIGCTGHRGNQQRWPGKWLWWSRGTSGWARTAHNCGRYLLMSHLISTIAGY